MVRGLVVQTVTLTSVMTQRVPLPVGTVGRGGAGLNLEVIQQAIVRTKVNIGSDEREWPRRERCPQGNCVKYVHQDRLYMI